MFELAKRMENSQINLSLYSRLDRIKSKEEFLTNTN